MLCVLIRITSSDFKEYPQCTNFNIKKEITLNYPKSAVMGFCSKRLKKELETAVVNEPSVIEPLKFYCNNKMCPRYIRYFHINCQIPLLLPLPTSRIVPEI